MAFYKLKFKKSLNLLTALFLLGCQQPAENISLEFRVPVTVEEVAIATVESRILTTGRLRAIEVVTLVVKTTGLLQIAENQNGRLVEGDHVNAGDLIATITGEDVRLAIKREAVRQRLETAKSNFKTSQILYDKKLLSRVKLGNAKDLLEDAKLDYQISLNTESQNEIRTPIDGVILKLSRDQNGQRMANGQLVTEGQVIAQVAPLDVLIADIDLVSTDISIVQTGQVVRVNAHAWGDMSFSGKVLRLAPTIDEKTRTLQAEVSINNTNGSLKPGMFVEVAVIQQRRQGVPVIPAKAITERGGRKVVFVLKGQRVEQREVETGIRQGKKMEILNGIELGDRVVVLGIETLTDQMPVHVATN